MSLPLQSSAFITCALTGSGDSAGISDKVPVTPEQIAASAIEAAEAGAAVVHVHVRDPETGKGSQAPRALPRGRRADPRLQGRRRPQPHHRHGRRPRPRRRRRTSPPNDAGTDMASVTERLQHVAELKPEICTLDAGTMNFAAGGDYIMVNTPGMVRAMAKGIKDLGVKPEVEIFDTGDLVLLNELVKEGLIDDPAMIQLCMGIPYGAPNDVLTLQSMINNLPTGSVFSMFSIGRFQLPYAALAPLVGANVRVGLEDNLYLSKGVLASNGDLVGRAKTLLEAMNVRVMSPAEVRDKLGLVKHG